MKRMNKMLLVAALAATTLSAQAEQKKACEQKEFFHIILFFVYNIQYRIHIKLRFSLVRSNEKCFLIGANHYLV